MTKTFWKQNLRPSRPTLYIAARLKSTLMFLPCSVRDSWGLDNHAPPHLTIIQSAIKTHETHQRSIGVVGYHDAFTRRRPWVRFPQDVNFRYFFALLLFYKPKSLFWLLFFDKILYFHNLLCIENIYIIFIFSIL